jgi:hypothetical protein
MRWFKARWLLALIPMLFFAGTLIAQSEPTSPFVGWEYVLTGLLPIMVAVVGPFVYSGLRDVIKALNGLPDIAHQCIVFVINFIMIWGWEHLGLPTPPGLEQLTPEALAAFLSALGSFGIYKLLLKKPPA